MLKQAVKRMVNVLLEKPLPPISRQEIQFLSELQSTFQNFPVFDTSGLLPSEAEWLSNMNRLREDVLTNDPRQFLRWDVVLKTMFVEHAPYIRTELNYLKRHCDKWQMAIQESTVGHPPPYLFYPRSSGNTIHHAYHVEQFFEKTGIRASDIDCILEFGGGYGNFCRVLHSSKFMGRYVIYDLPPFSALQRYYLNTVELPEVDCISDFRQLELALSEFSENSLFVATWSISETPLHVRKPILDLVSGFRSFLIAYQDRFGEVDNLNFFDLWKRGIKARWHSWPIEHLPGSNYLIGTH